MVRIAVRQENGQNALADPADTEVDVGYFGDFRAAPLTADAREGASGG